MKKLITIILALMLVCSMVVPAHAATPRFEIPNVPEIPDISDNIKFEFPDGFWNSWFNNHPINWKPLVKAPEADSSNFVGALKNFIG